MELLSLLDEVSETSSRPKSRTSLETDLKRMLSIRTVVSTNSSEAAQNSDHDTYTKIGAGACGAIFSLDGSTTAIKLGKVADSMELWTDYKMHIIIRDAVLKHKIINVSVPENRGFIKADHKSFWLKNTAVIDAAKKDINFPTEGLVAERILPLAEPVRKLLIEKFCAPRIRAKAHADPANKDCLIRPYLGSLEGRTSTLFFSLRNFKLHLNQIDELGLDMVEIAKDMGEVLAVMHWEARTDARDVEFVLGSCAVSMRHVHNETNFRDMPKPARSIAPESEDIKDFTQRATTLWLLDFNQVRTISLDAAGVAVAIDAFKVNDPYFPRPLLSHPRAGQLWNAFATSYLDMSVNILGHGKLPILFLKGVINMQREKNAKKESKSRDTLDGVAPV
ncbi:hypothetical protein CORC01_11519 [Colletotrichum orchidophilum]|uniref:DUF3669 domain-containing protein n=1 Tax=Colletotrichum orchidophilum TaxID=1209926 RepID=A0A1G4AVW9_9PEZI|nr:uncharacterized protein CORC01_11519 [Colletotrichum orchidophilum]OHE93202.1 hypothetical protein CORC01_11519 [Colletotrichum orchidophilum]